VTAWASIIFIALPIPQGASVLLHSLRRKGYGIVVTTVD
jgi:hypothetical protein